MINVKVLFFGATAEAVGMREISISLEENLKAETAFSQILEKFPALETNHGRKSLLFSVNQEYAGGDEIIRAGDELAIFTAVSGG